MPTNKKPKKDQDEKYVPPFLKRLGIKPGEWFSAAKGNLRYFLRPGHPLRVRVAAAVMMQSEGYQRDVCIIQIKGETKNDPPRLLPLWPAGIESLLHRAAIAAYQESGVELDEAQRKTLKIDKGNIHAQLRELEEEDGLIVRVRANCDVRKLIADATPFEEAMKRKLITPVSELTKEERARLHNKTLIYKRQNAKPATAKALKRLDEQSAEGVKLHSFEATPEERQYLRMLYRILPKAGYPKDPALTMRLAHRPDVQAEIHTYRKTVETAEESLTAFLARMAGDEPAEARSPAPTRTDAPAAASAPATGTLVSMPRRARAAMAADSDAAAIAAAARCDTEAARTILASCRRLAPGCTLREIEEAINQKTAQAARSKKRYDNPTGFLIVAVPKLFDGAAYDELRAAVAQLPDTTRDAADQAERFTRLELEQKYADYCLTTVRAYFASLDSGRQKELSNTAHRAIKKQYSNLPAQTIAELAERQVLAAIEHEAQVMNLNQFADSIGKTAEKIA